MCRLSPGVVLAARRHGEMARRRKGHVQARCAADSATRPLLYRSVAVRVWSVRRTRCSVIRGGRSRPRPNASAAVHRRPRPGSRPEPSGPQCGPMWALCSLRDTVGSSCLQIFTYSSGCGRRFAWTETGSIANARGASLYQYLDEIGVSL